MQRVGKFLVGICELVDLGVPFDKNLAFPEAFRFAPQVCSLREPYRNKAAPQKKTKISFTTWGTNERSVRGTNRNRNKKAKARTHENLGMIRNF